MQESDRRVVFFVCIVHLEPGGRASSCCPVDLLCGL